MTIQDIKRAVKAHGHHFIFGISILSIAALALWWTVFINNSIKQRRQSHYENLELRQHFISLKLGTEKTSPPELGLLKEDQRFEVVLCASKNQKLSSQLKPFWPDYCIQPLPSAFESIEQEFRKHRLMLIGESSLLMFLVLISSIFLYHYIQLEKRSTREVREFWGRLTHEIKTPITGIKAFLQSLKNRTLSLKESLPYVELALKQIDRQEKLAENVLAAQRLESTNLKLNLARINIGSFLDEFFDKHPLYLSGATAVIDFKNGKDLAVRADSHALKVIFGNITDNAIKYCPQGFRMDISVSKERKRAIIDIRDNGPGFPAYLRRDVFSAYKHLSRRLSSGGHGSGMGLYISKQLAKKMGGDLKAFVPQKGRGVQLKLYLKLWD